MLVAIATPNMLDPVALAAASGIRVRLAGQNIVPRPDGPPDISYVSVLKTSEGIGFSSLRQVIGPYGLYGVCEDDATYWRFYALVTGSLDIERGSVWKHHANGYYEILTITNLLGDMAGKFRPEIVYRNIDNGNEFSRTTDQWFSKFTFVAARGETVFREPVQFKANEPVNDIGAVINKTWSIRV